MKSYWVKTPSHIQKLFPKRIWSLPSTPNAIYLTFDDGPIPEVTPWVLDTLKKHEAKATFFCIGDNVRKHPEIFKQITAQGHTVGNHTFHHKNGWKTKYEAYLEDCKLCEDVMNIGGEEASKLFRPPYGKLTARQSKALRQQGYKIIMWDVLSADFDTALSEEQCLRNVIENIAPGSIVVFHDSLKARLRLEYALPKVLAYISEKGFTCEGIQ